MTKNVSFLNVVKTGFSNPAHAQKCERCGSEFVCGDTETQKCWCNSMPPLPDPNFAKSCLCRACLEAHYQEKMK